MTMWKPIYDLSRILFGLAEHVQEDRDEIKEIRRDLRDLTLVVERLPSQIARSSGSGTCSCCAWRTVFCAAGWQATRTAAADPTAAVHVRG